MKGVANGFDIAVTDVVAIAKAVIPNWRFPSLAYLNVFICSENYLNPMKTVRFCSFLQTMVSTVDLSALQLKNYI